MSEPTANPPIRILPSEMKSEFIAAYSLRVVVHKISRDVVVPESNLEVINMLESNRIY
jgi:hypothetical protein